MGKYIVRGNIHQPALYGCTYHECEMAHPAADLRVHDGDELWCCDCWWDYRHPEVGIEWSDLPEFDPHHTEQGLDMAGLALVPMEPTYEMLAAGQKAWLSDPLKKSSTLYKAMVAAAPVVEQEPVAWQFFDEGKWWPGWDNVKDHRKNTEAAGYPVRDLYPHPLPSAADQLVGALVAARIAIGEHKVPGDCYSTGPATGDPAADLLACPACAFIAKHDEAIAAYRCGGES